MPGLCIPIFSTFTPDGYSTRSVCKLYTLGQHVSRRRHVLSVKPTRAPSSYRRPQYQISYTRRLEFDETISKNVYPYCDAERRLVFVRK